MADSGLLLMPSLSESERFGLRVGRLTVSPDGSDEDALDAAGHAVRTGRFELVIVRLPRPLETHGPGGIEVLDAGCVVSYSADVDPRRFGSRVGGAGHVLRRIEQWGAREGAIVEEIFAGHRNHVTVNPRLDASLVPAGYADWSARHVDGRVPGDCFVLEDAEGQSLAFAAVAPYGDTLVINLAGVLPAHRGRGVYQTLLDLIEDKAEARGNTRIRISTQVETAVAIRAWERRGWSESGREWTVHVMDGPEGKT